VPSAVPEPSAPGISRQEPGTTQARSSSLAHPCPESLKLELLTPDILHGRVPTQREQVAIPRSTIQKLQRTTHPLPCSMSSPRCHFHRLHRLAPLLGELGNYSSVPLPAMCATTTRRLCSPCANYSADMSIAPPPISCAACRGSFSSLSSSTVPSSSRTGLCWAASSRWLPSNGSGERSSSGLSPAREAKIARFGSDRWPCLPSSLQDEEACQS
jgi:hypothetical protein